MKRVLSILMLSLILASCKSDQQTEKDSYIISGTAPGVHNGVRAYLKTVDNQRREIIQDTAIIRDGIFTFKGKVDVPQLWYLSINGVNGSFPLIIENEELIIRGNSEDLTKSIISGSKSNEAFTTYTKNIQELSENRHALLMRNTNIQRSNDTEEKARIAIQIKNINQQLAAFPMSFISEHPDNSFSLLILESLIGTPDSDLVAIEKQYKALDSDIITSDYGQRVSEQLNAKKTQRAQFSTVDVGKMAPNFSAPDPDGNTITLSDIKGKVTIIDFWASWCGPCRKENPNVVKVYQKYHNKGLEIINVSLDRPGHKDIWIKAIADDKLTWHHVSNLNYFNDPVAKLYHIRSIPSTYILDETGTIVAKNLRGSALEAKIAELLN